MVQNQPPIVLHSRFSVEVYSPSLCDSHDIRKVVKVFCQSFPSLHEAGSTGLHGTYGRPSTRPDLTYHNISSRSNNVFQKLHLDI